jgi:hypothetical protein
VQEFLKGSSRRRAGGEESAVAAVGRSRRRRRRAGRVNSSVSLLPLSLSLQARGRSVVVGTRCLPPSPQRDPEREEEERESFSCCSSREREGERGGEERREREREERGAPASKEAPEEVLATAGTTPLLLERPITPTDAIAEGFASGKRKEKREDGGTEERKKLRLFGLPPAAVSRVCLRNALKEGDEDRPCEGKERPKVTKRVEKRKRGGE